ncbi:MAG: serine/threonine-protein kinase [Candidatus Eisenbacteria bacterium]|nr:serine/threonine-protein kinase [Candidatus Eisenbacteria bacterium]
MSLDAGTKLGPYEIVAPLGQGGMGEVYRARDTRLGRDVAIKALPDGFDTDAERVARFEREAKLLASLHHTNIGSIFGLEVVEGRRYLVLEFIEGETLQARLARGPLPLAETLDVCAQIATAVEAAHEAGVIHRDLKPGNVMLKADGVVKVLDFGLAKSSSGDGSPSSTDLSASPTMTYAATGVGVILGTAAYMSPEQARGKQVDRRTDIWSFGCVLFECLSGKRVIEGETVSDMVARILEREPDWSLLPASTPAHVVALLKRCLTKDARARLRDIGEARIVLSGGSVLAAATVAPAAAPASAPPVSTVQWRSGLVLGIGALACIALGVFLPLRRSAPEPSGATRLSMLEPSRSGRLGEVGSFALSPDGRSLVFTLTDSAGTDRLWVRSLAQEGIRLLEGTEGATWPFWSPDSRDVAFFSEGKLRRIAISGGGARALCAASSGRGGAWGSAGQIVFSPDPRGGIFAVAAGGGVPRALTAVDSAAGETSHRFPTFLPDGKHFLFVVNAASNAGESQVMTGALDGARIRPLLTAHSAPVFAAPDRILFTRDGALLAQRMDLRTLAPVGEPEQLADQVEAVGSVQLSPLVSCSETGVMAYVPRDHRPTAVAWVEADGRLTPTRVVFPVAAGTGVLSPDDRRFAVACAEPSGYSNWIGDLETGAVAQIAPMGRGVHFPAWNPAGTRIVGATKSGLLQIDPASGADSALALGDQLWRTVTGWTPDGKTMITGALVEGNRFDIQTIDWQPGAKPKPWLATPADENVATLSPDGRHIAYVSDVSGRFEVYIADFPARAQTIRVGSTNFSTLGRGAAVLVWSRDGRELYFLSQDGASLLATEVSSAPVLGVGRSRVVRQVPRGVDAMCMLQDGRMLVMLPQGERARSITVASGWMSELEKTK